jgi:ParB family chromosome partitioning protein
VAKNRLGKGLGALLPDDEPASEERGNAAEAHKDTGKVRPPETLPLEKILANPGQPRRRFDQDGLEELAASIKEHGIIQPIIVDESGDGNYVIVAGERRSRAAKIAGLREVPVVIRNYTDVKRLEVALVENVQRADLNPIEEAAAYKRLMETSGLSQDEAAARVGKNRSTVANALRLLKLPPEMRESLEDGSLSAGHARAILSLAKAADQEKLYKEITAGGLSVREAEKRAAVLAGKAAGGKEGGNAGSGKSAEKREPELKAMEDRLIETLGTKVSIAGNLKKGRIEIEYYSMDDLDRIYGILGK